ncbi:MAG TPA: hypothetical protein VFK17_06255 [Gaiellaceae bacterium]|nr:hypothetical protein [Gaiellaceae bacterium]
MAIREVQTAVEVRLGRPVSFQTVSDYLIRRSKGEKPLFARTRYGHYRAIGGQIVDPGR